MTPSHAVTVARNLMNANGLGHWTLQLDRAKTRLGGCNNLRQITTLSRYYVVANDEAHIQNTVLHEIAHALTPLTRGHGWEWRSKCRELGIRPERCAIGHVEIAPHAWQLRCPLCSATIGFYRKPTVRRSCSKCTPLRFNPALVMLLEKVS